MLAKLFERVEVEHVWCIDDLYGSPRSVEEIADAIGADQLADELLTSVATLNSAGAYQLGREGVDRVEVLDALAAAVRADQLDAHELDVLRAGIVGAPDSGRALGELRRHLTEAGVKFKPLGPAEWSSARQEISGDGSGYLFLVDQQLGVDQPRGLRIAEEIANYHSGARVAVLTDTGTRDAAQAWRDQVLSGIDNPELIGWVLKADIGSGEPAVAKALRRVFTLPELIKVRDLIVGHHQEALEAAAESLSKLDAQDLHEAFFSSQLDAGSDEMEVMSTLLRRQIEIRATQLQWSDNDLAETSGYLRDVAHGIPEQSRSTTPRLVTLQREALYDIGQHVSASALPLLPGDIFAVLDGEQWWGQGPVHLLPRPKLCIVVGQACDLAVRDDGVRKGEPASIDVVEVEAWEGNRPPEVGQQTRHGQLLFGLPYLLPEGGHAYAPLRSNTLPALAVDLAVFNPTGRANTIPQEGLSLWILPGWRDRHELLLNGPVTEKAYVLKRLHRLSRQGQGVVRGALAGPSTVSLEIDLHGDVLGFNLARVGRLARHVANALVTAVRAAQSRPAFERPIIDPAVPLEGEAVPTESV